MRSLSIDDRVVVAAVHPDSGRLDEIVRRAQRLAEQQQAPLVYVVVMTRRPHDEELTRMRRRLRPYGRLGHLVVTWIDGEGLMQRDRDALVGRELAAAAERLSASALVVGSGPADSPVDSDGVVSILAARLAVGTDLCLASSDAAARVAEHEQTVGGGGTWSVTSQVAGDGSSISATMS
jgi:K+-sensing histidine kinase KdpD